MKTYPSDFEKTLEDVVKQLAPTFTFGYFDTEDIAQEARLFGYTIMSKYDKKRPLGNFLYTVIKRHLINFKRDNFTRTDPPCLSCHNGDYCSEDGPCNVYKKWKKRNSTKAGLMQPMGIDEIIETNEPHCKSTCGNKMFEELVAKELIDRIIKKLPANMVKDFNKVLIGDKISESKKKNLISEVKYILEEDKNDGN